MTSRPTSKPSPPAGGGKMAIDDAFTDDPEMAMVTGMLDALASRVSAMKVNVERRTLGSSLDLLGAKSAVTYASVEEFSARDPALLAVRAERERLRRLLAVDYREVAGTMEASVVVPPPPPTPLAIRSSPRTPAPTQTSPKPRLLQPGVPLDSLAFSPLDLRRKLFPGGMQEGGGGGGASGGGGVSVEAEAAFRARLTAVKATAQRLKHVQMTPMATRMVPILAYSPTAHLPLISSASTLRVLRGEGSTSGKAYASELHAALTDLRKREAEAAEAAAAHALGLTYDPTVSKKRVRASAVCPDSDLHELFPALPLLLKFTAQRLAPMPTGFATLTRVLASPHAVALAAGAFWLCILSLQENVRLQREKRMQAALSIGLVGEEAEGAVSKAEAAEMDAFNQVGGGNNSSASGSGSGSASGSGVRRAGNPALSPPARRAALLTPDLESDTISTQASLLAALHASPTVAAQAESITQAMARVYLALMDALRVEVRVEQSRGRMRPLRAAAERELEAWAADGGERSGVERPDPPPPFKPLTSRALRPPHLNPLSPADVGGLSAKAGGDSTSQAAAQVLPWAIADTVWHALCVLCPASNILFTARLKLDIFVKVGGLLGGVEVSTTAALQAQDTLFQPLLLIQVPGTAGGGGKGGGVASPSRRNSSSAGEEGGGEESEDKPPPTPPFYPPDITYAKLDPRDPTDAYGCAGELGSILRRGKKTGKVLEARYPAPLLCGPGGKSPNRAAHRVVEDEVEQARLLGFKNPSMLFRSTTQGERALMTLRDAVKAELSRGALPATRLPSSAFLAAGVSVPNSWVTSTGDLRSLIPPPIPPTAPGSFIPHVLASARAEITQGSILAQTERAKDSAGMWGRGGGGSGSGSGGPFSSRPSPSMDLSSSSSSAFPFTSTTSSSRVGFTLPAEEGSSSGGGFGVGGEGSFLYPPYHPTSSSLDSFPGSMGGSSMDSNPAAAASAASAAASSARHRRKLPPPLASVKLGSFLISSPIRGPGGGRGGGVDEDVSAADTTLNHSGSQMRVSGGGDGGLGDDTAQLTSQIGRPGADAHTGMASIIARTSRKRSLTTPFLPTSPSTLMTRGLSEGLAYSKAVAGEEGGLKVVVEEGGEEGEIGEGNEGLHQNQHQQSSVFSTTAGGLPFSPLQHLPVSLRGGFVATALHRSLPVPWANTGGVDTFFSYASTVTEGGSVGGKAAANAASSFLHHSLHSLSEEARAAGKAFEAERVAAHASLSHVRGGMAMGALSAVGLEQRKRANAVRREVAESGRVQRENRLLARSLGMNPGDRPPSFTVQAAEVAANPTSISLYNLAQQAQNAGVLRGGVGVETFRGGGVKGRVQQ